MQVKTAVTTGAKIGATRAVVMVAAASRVMTAAATTTARPRGANAARTAIRAIQALYV